jgi:hypothetical protein
MMCFLKGICGQCIQWQIQEDGSQLKAVYACSWPSQPMTLIDVSHLASRQQQGTVDQMFYDSWRQCQKKEEVAT